MMLKCMGPRPLAPLRGTITEPSFANQRYVWINRVTRLVDTVMILYVRSLTRIMYFRLATYEDSGESSQVLCRRMAIGVISSLSCDHATTQEQTWWYRKRTPTGLTSNHTDSAFTSAAPLWCRLVMLSPRPSSHFPRSLVFDCVHLPE